MELNQLKVKVSVKFNEERLQKAIKVFEQEISDCIEIEIGRPTHELPTRLEGSD